MPPRCPSGRSFWTTDGERDACQDGLAQPRESERLRDEKKNERVLGVARTIKKRASAQILAGSKLPEKRNNR